MIVISDRTLRAAGLDLREAVGLLEPPEGELVVHIRQELDDIPSLGIPPLKPQDELSGGNVRTTYRASAPDEEAVPTIEPTNARPVYTARPAAPASAAEVDAARAALQRQHDTLAISAATLGLKEGTWGQGSAYGRPWWRCGSQRLP